MPLRVTDALVDQQALGVTKAGAAASPGRYTASSALAGAYVGVGVVLVASAAGPLAAAASPFTTLVAGCVFGVALTLIVFAGAELFTGNAMVMLQALAGGRAGWAALGRVWGLSLVGNLAGSVLFAGLVHGGGTLSGGKGAGAAWVAATAQAKASAGGGQLFFRAVLCNFLVCLALWMAARASGDAAKLGVVWWALLAFFASGFEHSVANMTLFGLAAFAGDAGWGDLARNLAWTVPGNVVGGGILVGLAYAWIAQPAPAPAPVAAPAAAPTADPRPAAPAPAPTVAPVASLAVAAPTSPLLDPSPDGHPAPAA